MKQFPIISILFPLAVGLAVCSGVSPAQQNPPAPGLNKEEQSPRGSGGGQGRGEIKMPTPAFRTEVPSHSLDLILGRPTKNSVTLSVLAYEDMEGYVAYGT